MNLEKEMDKTKSRVFLGNNAAFLGTIMCSLEFSWDSDIPTACTNGTYMKWNPTWFLSLPEATRCTVLVHELWHVARLHAIRGEGKKHREWNWACDFIINNGMEDDGYTFEGTEPCLDQEYSGMSEEEVYEKLVENDFEISPSSWSGDIEPPTSIEKQQTVSIVVKAIQTVKMLGQYSKMVANIEELVEGMLKPVIPWQRLLYNFFDAMVSDEYSWKRPNRRYQDMYLPCKTEDDIMLKNLHYYFDVSGSVDTEQLRRFNTELKHVKTTFNPERMTLIQFDTSIRCTELIESNAVFDKLKAIGRGGTDLEPVREHIHKTKPTAAIIFSDLDCPPMEPLDFKIPIIWIVIGNPDVRPSFGTVIHLTE